MRRRGLLLPLILVVGLAIAADPAPSADKPWAPALIEMLPEAYRAAGRQHLFIERVREEQWLRQLEQKKIDEVFIFRGAVSRLAVKPEGVRFLIGMLKTEGSADRRVQIAEALLPSRYGESSEGRKFLDELMFSDPSVKVFLAVMNHVMWKDRVRMVPVLERRLALANQRGDAEGADLLWRRRNDFAGTTLPEFAYRAPAVFQAAPSGADLIRVLAFGDFGTGGPKQLRTAEAMRAYQEKSPFAFGLTLGDNFYQKGLPDPQSPRWKTEWEDLYTPLGVKFYATLGNHDYGQPDSPAAQIAYSNQSPSWRMPAPFYSFTAGPAQFFALDTVRLERKQLDWLAQALAQSTAQWKIVYGHYHIYSANRGDNDHTYHGQDLVGRLLPILKKGKADIYLCGHEHNLQELKPEEGVHFFVAGSGGAGLYDFERQDEYRQRSLFSSKEHGFVVLEILRDKVTLSFIGIDGKALHRREILKTG